MEFAVELRQALGKEPQTLSSAFLQYQQIDMIEMPLSIAKACHWRS